jgi:glutathione-regulated potassium-efflux system ancillary protein KefG
MDYFKQTIMYKILVIFAHPALHKSRIHKKLSEAARTVEGLTFNDLYGKYPDFYINIKREQKLLLDHDIIIWQHPFYWYSCPALMKEWIDLVLENNFAYGRTGTFLHGKKVMSAISTGGSAGVYTESGGNHYTIRQFLAPFHQTALLCGMEYLPPFVVHGSHLLTKPDIKEYGDLYLRILTELRNGTLPAGRLTNAVYINELF